MLEVKTIIKVVHLGEEEHICMCDKEFFKTCVDRVKNDFVCKECVVRISPIAEREQHEEDVSIFSGPKQFQNTLEQMGSLK
jgi:hypothetical protein